ncbi:MAG TPA: DUF2497 domain-containing protein [Ancylobacter sp.]
MEEILASIRRIISDEVAAEAIAAPSPEIVPAPQAAPVPVAPPVRSFSEPAPRPALASAARSEPTPSPYAPKRPLLPPYDPFAPRPRTLSSAAVAPVESLRTVSQARPLSTPPAVAPEPVAVEPPAPDNEPDMDAPFAAALMDLAMVEQAVQAELASVMADAIPSAESAAAELSLEDIATMDEPAVGAAPSTLPKMASHTPPEAFTPSEAFTAPETADMQVQAKPAPTLPRATAAAPVPTERFTAPAVPTSPAPAPVEPPRGLVSAPTNNAVAASFGSLARTVASNSRSVEDVVTDAVRPMLKAWLDENLPALVERLVRAEIERVARHGS